jgi:hypothetical protein
MADGKTTMRMGFASALLLAASTASLAPAAAGRQPPGPLALLPDTSEGIHLFADQFSGGYSDKLVRFAATRYAGTQKLQKRENDRYRAVNPRWVLLHYRLGSSSGPAQYIRGDRWTSDWREVSSHEDWFLHNDRGQRHHDPVSNWDLHDLRHPGFREYWVTSVIADMRASGAQGVFADSFDAGVSGYGITPPDNRFVKTAPADPAAWTGGVSWLQQKVDFIAYVKDRFEATPERFLFVPNVTLATAWWWPDYGRIDGAMFEGFTLGLSPGDWVLAMNRALELSRAGKFLIAQGYPKSVDDRLFLLVSYLLIKGTRTFINSAGAGIHFFPEYELAIGRPLASLPDDIAGYAWNGIYKREFTNAIALINPQPARVDVALPGRFRLAMPAGGGETGDRDVDAQGNYLGGSMTYRDVSSVTLEPFRAAVLMRQ